MPKNTDRVYLLRSVIKCGLCGLAFCGSSGRPGVWWYRCNGYLAERGGKDQRCQAKSIKNSVIEPAVWQDIERFLREPGDVLEELRAETAKTIDDAGALAATERITLQAALDQLEPRRERNLNLYERGRLTDTELDERLDQIESERSEIQRRTDAIQVREVVEPALDGDLLEAIRQRLDDGLTDEQRAEIVRLLVRQVTVHTAVKGPREKEVKLVIEYRLSPDWCSRDVTGKGSSPRPA